MAGRAYALPPPKPDVQPKGTGASPIGYEDGFKPPARYSKSTATETWKPATDSVTNQLHCNLQTRVSLAATLDDAAQRDMGINTYTPGRRTAPRAIVSCQPSPESLRRPSGAYARDLALTLATKIPKNSDGGPWSGPDGKTTGLDPLPKAPPPTPKAPPVLVTVPAIEIPEVDVNVAIANALSQNSPRVPGTLQTINFHFTGDLAGGSATSELRVFGPISSPFIIRQLWINSDSGITPGQFLDVLVSPDGNTNDTATPSGNSIFELLQDFATLPSPDNQRGIALPPVSQDLKLALRVDLTNRFIKVQTLFVAPAIGLPNCHVTIAIERLDSPSMTIPPIVPRPPLIAPGPPPPPPGAHYDPAAFLAAVPQAQPYATADTVLPAWRVAALGLPPVTGNGVMGSYPLLDAYNAWQLDPTSTAAAPFRERIDTVLKNANVSGGNQYTIIPTSAAIAPTTTTTR